MQTKLQTKLDMPREKLNKKGAEALTDVELLQAVVGSGGKGNDYRQIAKNLLDAINRTDIEKLTIDDVKAIKGMGDAKATVIFAAFEFWRRKFTKQTRPVVDTAEIAAAHFDFIKDKRQECLAMITLDGARRLIKKHTVTVGLLTSSPVHPREVFAPAVEDRAASIIIAHNHPSGSLEISAQDREVTRRIKEAGELMGIKLDDHIIVSAEGFVSAL